MLASLRRTLGCLALCCGWVGCAAASTPAGPEANTLRTNRHLPAHEMKRLCESNVWAKLSNLDFTGYVVMEGRLDGDGHVKVRKATRAVPDQTRNELAAVFANKAVVPGVSSASRIPPRAIVYVVFYENLRGSGNLAVVFAKQLGGSSEGNAGGMYFKTLEY